jgi:hypothetical protein
MESVSEESSDVCMSERSCGTLEGGPNRTMSFPLEQRFVSFNHVKQGLFLCIFAFLCTKANMHKINSFAQIALSVLEGRMRGGCANSI